MSFFTYRQNNSGGHFCGPAKYVIIEADNADEANRIAEDHDIYFNGCMTGSDCPCCGDRWHECDASDAKDQPMIYGKEIALDQTVYESEWGGKSNILIVTNKDRNDERKRAADLLSNNGFWDAAEFLRRQS